jgi:hypothetical protein
LALPEEHAAISGHGSSPPRRLSLSRNRR